MDGDGRIDIVVQAPGSGGLWVIKQLADGSLAAPLTLLGFDTGSSIVVADFNGDGRPDIAATWDRGGGPRVFLQAANGTFEAGRSYAGSDALLGSGMAVMDVNADGRPDIVLEGPYVLLNLSGSVTNSQATPAELSALRAKKAVRASAARRGNR